MPFLAMLLVNAAAGFAVALAASRELRASPRSAPALASFAGLAAYELLVAAPAALYLLLRHTDWMLSYAVHGARIPSALMLVASVAYGACALATFFAGARWMRDHRPRWSMLAAGGLAAIALVGLAVMRERSGVVGTTAQYRGGFGLVGFWASRASTAVVIVAMVQAAALAHLAWSLQRAQAAKA